MDLSYFGLRLKEIRQYQNITQKELSHTLNISRQAYSNYEQGRCAPSTEILARLSILLNYNLFIPFIQAVQSDKTQKNYPLCNYNILYPDEYSQLISLYKSLSLDKRESLIDLLKLLAKEENTYGK